MPAGRTVTPSITAPATMRAMVAVRRFTTI
jgi:hypothetical protein